MTTFAVQAAHLAVMSIPGFMHEVWDAALASGETWITIALVTFWLVAIMEGHEWLRRASD